MCGTTVIEIVPTRIIIMTARKKTIIRILINYTTTNGNVFIRCKRDITNLYNDTDKFF